MVYLRAALGFALMGTVLWLGTVLAAQLGTDGALVFIAIAIVLLGVLWLERRLDEGRAWVRVVSLAPFVALAALLPHRFLPPASSLANAGDSRAWQAFDRAAIDAAVRNGRVVFVDVTADWCVTCQVNKSLVLRRGEVAQRLAGPSVVAMRADWTRPDARIADYLASFGRYGIPFNAVYGPGAPGGLPLPELLSAEAVLSAIDQAGRKRAALP
jgi:suppressor for copper-sensitivity B